MVGEAKICCAARQPRLAALLAEAGNVNGGKTESGNKNNGAGWSGY